MKIESLRVNGASLDSLASEFGVSRDSIHRHFKHHVSDKRRAELMIGAARGADLAKAAEHESRSLLDDLRITKSILFSQLVTCAEAGDRNGVATISGKLLDALGALGRLSGELREIAGISITNNVFNLESSPQYPALKEGLLKIMRTYPDTRVDIIALIRSLDDDAISRAPAVQLPLIEGSATNV